MIFEPTEQQSRVVNHTKGHARVLAIAGSGKTTTMVFRIKNLIEVHNINPKLIRVLMFNKAAAEDFKMKLKEIITLANLPYVSTFHSFGYQFIQLAIKEGFLSKYHYWINENEFKIDLLLKKIIKEFEKRNLIEKDKIELEEVKTSISLWKGSLIGPENAGHKINEDYVLIYKEFEKCRNEANALTFDDFIPLTIKILKTNQDHYNKWANKLEHLIVDEYQDVNFGQQTLIEILAGNKANVMVVGDDDQTIYEWRGARPEYILKEFETTFTSKAHSIYKLDRTFRFGPLLAQYAHNSISLNSTRHSKNVLANESNCPTDIEIVLSSSNDIFNTNEILTNHLTRLVKVQMVKPKDIRIIGRLYSQFTGLETSFIINKVPYKIEGNIPFFKKREVKILVDYAQIFESYESSINLQLISSLLNIINTPNRKINKSRLEIFLKKNKGKAFVDVLDEYSKDHKDIEPLLNFLIEGNLYLNEQIENNTYNTANLIEWIYTNSELQSHYLNYYGRGEQAIDKISTTIGFINFCSNLQKKPRELSTLIENLDTTMGLPDEKLILFSTVYKTKGLEFDYVFIPDCLDGNMPYINDSQVTVYNTLNPELITKLSDSLESERRLFYVAITRAMKRVYIGADENNGNKVSRFIEEIMFDKTRDVLFPVVNSGDLNQEWLEKVKKVLGYKKIINNLKLYLNFLHQNEIRQIIDDLEINVIEEEFSYKNAYSSKRSLNLNLGNETTKNDTDASDPWDNVIVN